VENGGYREEKDEAESVDHGREELVGFRVLGQVEGAHNAGQNGETVGDDVGVVFSEGRPVRVAFGIHPAVFGLGLVIVGLGTGVVVAHFLQETYLFVIELIM